MISLLRDLNPGSYRVFYHLVRIGRSHREDQFVHQIGIINRQILGDHAALGNAEYRRSVDPNLFHGQRLIFSHLPDGITFRHIVFPAEYGNGIFIQMFLIWRFQKDTLPFYRRQSV